MRAKVKNEKLKTFLESKGALKQFEKNCEKLNQSDNLAETVTDILGGFAWQSSPEGMMYWWKLSDEFDSI